jgi:hypothetical protein
MKRYFRGSGDIGALLRAGDSWGDLKKVIAFLTQSSHCAGVSRDLVGSDLGRIESTATLVSSGSEGEPAGTPEAVAWGN